eukprot:scaffold100881_cov28-Tisochrysis_lutea.AAC.10
MEVSSGPRPQQYLLGRLSQTAGGVPAGVSCQLASAARGDRVAQTAGAPVPVVAAGSAHGFATVAGVIESAHRPPVAPATSVSSESSIEPETACAGRLEKRLIHGGLLHFDGGHIGRAPTERGNEVALDASRQAQRRHGQRRDASGGAALAHGRGLIAVDTAQWQLGRASTGSQMATREHLTRSTCVCRGADPMS